ncbi:hypothetical protein ACQP00_06300 [Dactylosporangium sp. CS-047395]|uniref:hypothetical protein n=1 Tax=Dactylosporangium sp. CS-047395 TaxID=3239936 RepID=UPI003D8D1614
MIPHVREDLRLSLDPFLLWQSSDPLYQRLHRQLIAFVDLVCQEAAGGRIARAVNLLGGVQELQELGLGYALGTKRGAAIGPVLARRMAETIRSVPQLVEGGFSHLEIVALLVPKVAEDRISDITASVLLHWLTEFTSEQCNMFGFPTRQTSLDSAWDAERALWRPLRVSLPWNPLDGKPILLAPLDLLRHLPWINYEDYYRSAYAPFVLPAASRDRRVAKEAVLAYNRTNFQTVEQYITERELRGNACTPDPLFKPLGLDALAKKLKQIKALPTGTTNGADKKYENLCFDLLSSFLYPELDLADDQVRTIANTHVRDIIFHNDGKNDFLADLRTRLGMRQVVFELKNSRALETENVNQLYRYLDDQEFGRVGILLTRHPTPPAVAKNIVDLWSAKRYYILCMDDRDLDLMLQLAQSGRRPVEAFRKKFVEFTRKLPQ